MQNSFAEHSRSVRRKSQGGLMKVKQKRLRGVLASTGMSHLDSKKYLRKNEYLRKLRRKQTRHTRLNQSMPYIMTKKQEQMLGDYYPGDDEEFPGFD